MTSENDDCVAFYWYYKNRKNKRKYLVHLYIQNNVNCRIFVAANELMQDDIKFQSFYQRIVFQKKILTYLWKKLDRQLKNKTLISTVVYETVKD